MKVTVIGHWGGYPETDGCTAGYLVQEDGFNLLLDCGSSVLANLQKYISILELNAVVLTHYHHDHVADIGPLQYAILINTMLGKIKRTLPIYGHNYDEEGLKRLTMNPYTEGIPYTEEDVMTVGPFKISFCKTVHPVPCCAVKVESKGKSFVFTGDTGYSQSLIEFTRGCDLLIAECSFYAGQSGSNSGHLNSVEAGKMAEEAAVQQLFLSHLPHFGDRDQLVEEAKSAFVGKVSLAERGLVWVSK